MARDDEKEVDDKNPDVVILRTHGGKSLQDEVAGVIYHPFRPYVGKYTTFLERRQSKNEHGRGKEVVVITTKVPSGLDDATLQKAWEEYRKTILAATPQADLYKLMDTFVDDFVKGFKPEAPKAANTKEKTEEKAKA